MEIRLAKNNTSDEFVTTTSFDSIILDCHQHFEQLLCKIGSAAGSQAHEAELMIFRELLALGLLLLKLFFSRHKQGDYGPTLETQQGLATRFVLSERTYFSIFGKVKIQRWLYHIQEHSFAPLDIVLNLPKRCYSFQLCRWVNRLSVSQAYHEAVMLLDSILGLKVSVSAAEMMSQESSAAYEDYYDTRRLTNTDATTNEAGIDEFHVVLFDGKGVPMIKKEAAKIQGRLDKGQKRQKKKEALVGATYTAKPQVRLAAAVAQNLVYPEQKTEFQADHKRTSSTRYVASLKKPKRGLMREIYDYVSGVTFTALMPLICVIDGARSLERAFIDVFNAIEHKIIILDIIHVLEYIWNVAHVLVDGDQTAKKKYVYDQLLLILNGKVANVPKVIRRRSSKRSLTLKIISHP
jgi:hypothetical protein